jgi:two-component system, NarL family, response regulator YdfI
MGSVLDVCIMAGTPARRDWLVGCVAGDAAIRVAGMAPTFPALRSLMADISADVAVLDWQPDREALIAREWLVELLELVPIVVLAPEHDGEIFNRIVQAKTGGMLRTDASSDQIVRAIQSAASGLMIFDSALMPPRPGDGNLMEPLTARETEVLRLLADGLANREIAARLNISEHTIKFHIRSILGKLGASSRTEAVTRGLRSGLIEL